MLDRLWADVPEPHGVVHALLDGARDRRIERMVRRVGNDYGCLYSGKLSERLKAAAPYLVRLGQRAKFTRELLEQGWGRSWGIFVVTHQEVAVGKLRRHFRPFLKVKDESGRTLVFRYYDPRVLRVYLPTCTDSEAEQFFGPVVKFWTEGPTPDELWAFERRPGGIRVDKHEL